MAVSKITCPECSTVLRPAKPLPAGKPVKCPECGHRFAAPDEEAPQAPPKGKKAATAPEAADRKPKKAADSPKASPKKPAGKTAAEKKPAAKKADDDEEGGVYGYLKEDEAEDEGKPDIEYAPDMTVKDPRPAAYDLLRWPSNLLFRAGALSFIGWLVLIFGSSLLVLTPLQSEGDKTQPPKRVVGLETGLASAAKDSDMPNEPTDLGNAYLTIFGMDLSKVANIPLVGFLLWLVVFLLPMAYCAVLVYASIRMQHMDGYVWGWVASIMGLFSPFYSLGLIILMCILVALAIAVLGAGGVAFWPMSAVTCMVLFGGPAAGVYGIVTMKRQEVIDAYNYKPE